LASGELVYSHQGRELGRVALKGAAVTTPSSCCHSDREFVVRSAGQVLTSGSYTQTTPALAYLCSFTDPTPVDDSSGLLEWEEK
jgi:hypothetical protein